MNEHQYACSDKFWQMDGEIPFLNKPVRRFQLCNCTLNISLCKPYASEKHSCRSRQGDTFDL